MFTAANVEGEKQNLINAIEFLEEEGGMAINIYNRKRVYIIPDRESFLKDATNKAKLCAVTLAKKKKGASLANVLVEERTSGEA